MDWSLSTIVLWAVPVVFAVTLHEAAHGYVARMFGDRTAELQGRITLNPIAHVDLVGTILVPGMLILAAAKLGGPGFVFGWAKPVPVNFGNLRNPRRDMLWVAAAGPGANLLMALLWAVVLKFGGPSDQPGFVGAMAIQGITFNIVLMVLNLLPIPPLDGGRIMVSILPMALARPFAQIERFGFMVVILLMATGMLNMLMAPLVRSSLQLITAVFGF